ncbi:MAG: 6,7-dimethyl-8-ribityllumazine synthase [Limisphaerales bacterium]
MLRKNPNPEPKTEPKTEADNGTFAIVASRYNAHYVDAMLRAAKAELWRAEVSRIQIIRVPGAYEIPVVVKRLARTLPGLSAIVCLGVVLRGETAHAAHIGDTVSRALMEIQLAYEIPVIHQVLLLENEEQARVRCLDPKHNRGTEAAQTALAMVHVLKSLQS